MAVVGHVTRATRPETAKNVDQRYRPVTERSHLGGGGSPGPGAKRYGDHDNRVLDPCSPCPGQAVGPGRSVPDYANPAWGYGCREDGSAPVSLVGRGAEFEPVLTG